MSAKSVCNDRLRKEFAALCRKPLEHVQAAPREANILEWHYVIEAPKGSVYEGGYYHGTVTFPSTYPFSPPSIQMLTPNGRFKVNTRLCLSMSDFHPESWNPMWSVGTILMGLFSFFLEDTPTHGSVVTSDSFKRRAAEESLAYNCRNKVFCELFPGLLEKHELEKRRQEEAGTVGGSLSTSNSNNAAVAGTEGVGAGGSSWLVLGSMLVGILGFLYALVFFAA